MAKHRLINCEFLNSGSFKVNISNRAKLLYLMMIVNADDLGFVDSTQEIINTLTSNDSVFNKAITLELLENTYNSALNELLDKGYLYEFRDNHENKVYLIKHWFFHNNYKKGLWTNYKDFKNTVYLDCGEYTKSKKPLKENNTNQDNVNQDKEISEQEYNEILKVFDHNEKGELD